jgi:hypothetical protein
MERKGRNRIEAELVRRLAAQAGVSDRAVRSWRARNSARWIDFLKRESMRDITPIEAAALRSDLEKSSPEAEEASATRRFLLLEKELDSAVERGQLSALPVITRAAEASHRFLASVREARIAHDTALRRLVPAHEVDRIRREIIPALANVLKNMPQEAGPRCNPFDHSFAIAALSEWLRDRFTPALDAAMGKLATVTGTGPPDTLPAPPPEPEPEAVAGPFETAP